MTWSDVDASAEAEIQEVDRLCELVARIGKTFAQFRAPWKVPAVL